MYNEKKHIKLSIDIGSLVTKYIAMQCLNGKEKIIDAKFVDTKKRIFDEDRNIKDYDGLRLFLDEIINRYKANKKFKSYDIVVYINLPYLENKTNHTSNTYYEQRDVYKEVRNFIKTSAQFDITKNSYAFEIVNNFKTSGTADSFILGYDLNTINFYLKYFDDKGIFVKSITVGSLPLISAISNDNVFDNSFEASTEEKYSLIVDLGASSTEVVLLKNSFPSDFFVINHGGNDLTQKLVEKFNLTVEDAEQLKVSVNETNFIYVDENQMNQVLLSGGVATVVNELKPVFEEWESSIYQDIISELKLQKIDNIDEIYFVGGSSYIKNFKEALARLFEAELKDFEVNNIYEVDRLANEADIIYYNLNLFLPALSNLIKPKFNLVTEKYTKAKRTKLPNVKGGNVILAASLALFIGSNALGYIQTATNNNAIQNINNRMDTLISEYQTQQKNVQEYDELDLKVKAFENRIVDKIKWSDLMRKIYDATPEGIQVLEVHEIGNGKVEIIGMAIDYKKIGLFGKTLVQGTDAALLNAEPSDIVSEQVKLTTGEYYEMKKFIIRGEIHQNNLVK